MPQKVESNQINWTQILYLRKMGRENVAFLN